MNEMMQELAGQDELSYSLAKTYTKGESVEGRVVHVDDKFAYVNIGDKSEAVISVDEFDEKPVVETVVRAIFLGRENDTGNPLLSKKEFDQRDLWTTISDVADKKVPVRGKIIRAVNKGFVVAIGSNAKIEAFLPQSHIFAEEQQKLLTDMDFYVLEGDEKSRKVVVSRKLFLLDEKKRKKSDFVEKRQIGETFDAVVKTVLDYGAFVAIDEGVEGFIHKNDISWGHVENAKNSLKVGDKMRVSLIELDKEKEKITFGLKQLLEDPWEKIEDNYKIGATVSGKISKIKNFGAFVELEEGVEGLLHIGDLSWTKKVKHPKEILGVNDSLAVKILGINKEERKISLGLKQMGNDPWESAGQRYAVNDIVLVRVIKIIKTGVFVELEEGIDGYIKNSDFSWMSEERDKKLAVDDKIKAQVLSIDGANKKIALGVKQTTDNPWNVFQSKFPKGSTVKGTVTRVADFGIFLKIDENIEGLIHISQVSNQRIDNLADKFKEGDELDALILKVDEKSKKVSLSLKALDQREERELISRYTTGRRETTSTIGELLKKD